MKRWVDIAFNRSILKKTPLVYKQNGRGSRAEGTHSSGRPIASNFRPPRLRPAGSRSSRSSCSRTAPGCSERLTHFTSSQRHDLIVRPKMENARHTDASYLVRQEIAHDVQAPVRPHLQHVLPGASWTCGRVCHGRRECAEPSSPRLSYYTDTAEISMPAHQRRLPPVPDNAKVLRGGHRQPPRVEGAELHLHAIERACIEGHLHARK